MLPARRKTPLTGAGAPLVAIPITCPSLLKIGDPDWPAMSVSENTTSISCGYCIPSIAVFADPSIIFPGTTNCYFLIGEKA